MPVWELKAEVRADAVEDLESWLAESEEARLMLLDERAAGRAWLAGYFETAEAAADARRVLADPYVASRLLAAGELRPLPDADWKESYRHHFRAWRFGPLAWVPVWERESFAPGAGERVLWLDPGMAFGTGNHETTRLCCERLVKLAAAHGTSGRVIDAGCGSGILALSAVTLGFARVAAFDNDPLAIEVSRENAALNGLAGKVNFLVGDLVTGLAGRSAEIVLANIQADVLTRFARDLVGAVAPGGVLVLSGILGRELPHVRESFAALVPGWAADSHAMGEWTDLLLQAPGG